MDDVTEQDKNVSNFKKHATSKDIYHIQTQTFNKHPKEEVLARKVVYANHRIAICKSIMNPC